MAGGRRPGAGRKPGTVNKATREAREKAAATGEMPLDYMLRVMRDKKAGTARRDAMASAAAPYLHPKLSAIQHSTPPGEPMQFLLVNRPPKEGGP